MDNFFLILKTSTKINGLIQIYKKKGDEQNRFTYSATPPLPIFASIIFHLNCHPIFLIKSNLTGFIILSVFFIRLSIMNVVRTKRKSMKNIKII